jgi:hypothetical protein
MTRRPILCAIAIAAAFALITFLTAWHIRDCPSPHGLASAGHAVLLAG